MPILNLKCKGCGYMEEKFMKKVQPTICPKCLSIMKVVPSKMGYRRDHTVVE